MGNSMHNPVVLVRCAPGLRARKNVFDLRRPVVYSHPWMSHLDASKVVIRSPEGRYLARGVKNWEFSEDRARAIVFDYAADNVAEHLELIKMAHGPGFEAVSVDPKEINESCDRCGSLVGSFQAFFDGKEFLCGACLGAARLAADLPAQGDGERSVKTAH